MKVFLAGSGLNSPAIQEVSGMHTTTEHDWLIKSPCSLSDFYNLPQTKKGNNVYEILFRYTFFFLSQNLQLSFGVPWAGIKWCRLYLTAVCNKLERSQAEHLISAHMTCTWLAANSPVAYCLLVNVLHPQALPRLLAGFVLLWLGLFKSGTSCISAIWNVIKNLLIYTSRKNMTL